MSLARSGEPALLLIDIQKGFEDLAYWGGQRNNLDAEARAAELLQTWRSARLPIFHIRHCSTTITSPLRSEHPGNAFQEIVQPLTGEPVIDKSVNSAFIGTHLQAQLEAQNISTLVIAGLTTDHCISTSTRMAGNLGFDVFVVADATATFCKTGINGEHYSAELLHDTALASLHREFATIVSSDFIKHNI